MISTQEEKVLTADVLIVGGGTAGCFAASAAASEGAKVVLLEQDFALGGAGVRGSIHFYWYGSTGGSQHKIDRAVSELIPGFGAKTVGFNPDAKRTALNQSLGQEPIQIVFGAMVYEVIKSNDRIAGVVAATEEGVLRVLAKVTIDATGDGDIAAAAGVPFQMGRETDGVVHVYSMVPRILLHDGKTDSINFDSGWVDPTDPWDVSAALIEGRKQIFDLGMQGQWELGRNVKPFSHLLGISPQLGIRESRLVAGDYQLTFDDLVMQRSFDDMIMRCFTHYDNHAPDAGNESLPSQIWKLILRLGMQKLACDIPYRSIVASGVDGLLLAGRCMSLERDAAKGIRMQRDMQKLGEAAGVAAGLSVRTGKPLRSIDIRELQEKLAKLGVIKENERNDLAYPNVQFEQGALSSVKLDMNSAEAHLDQIADYLGHENSTEQGRALWWIWKMGAPAAPVLLELWTSALPEAKRRAVLYAMSLLRMKEAIIPLTEMLASRDAEWTIAVILLRHIGTGAAALEAADVLAEAGCAANEVPLLLQYLTAIADQLRAEEKQNVAANIRRWVTLSRQRDELTMSRGKRVLSYRWSLVIGAAQLLHRLGDAVAADLCAEYTRSERKYIRTAAERALKRMKATPYGKEAVR